MCCLNHTYCVCHTHAAALQFYLDVAISLYTATPQYFIALAGAPLPVSVLFVGLHVAVVARFNYFINLPWPLFRVRVTRCDAAHFDQPCIVSCDKDACVRIAQQIVDVMSVICFRGLSDFTT